MIQQIVVNGLLDGSIFALLAIGFSLIFGVARVVNIAHTAFYMTAAYFIYVGSVKWGLPTYVSITLFRVGHHDHRHDLLPLVY